MKKITIGTRGSKLAQIQTNIVADLIKNYHPDINIEIKIIKTKGDSLLDVPISQFIDKGAFTKELEMAILNNEIDIAVHSLKDLPVELPDGLIIGAYLKRDEPNDVLISKNNIKLKDLKSNAVIATGSIRRSIQLNAFRSDISTCDIRGNIDTRINKFRESEWDGIILAYAALKRMNYEYMISDNIPIETMIPAVGQGIIAIENRNEKNIIELLHPINNHESKICAKAERSFLLRMGGGCKYPIAAYGYINDDLITMIGMFNQNNSEILFKDSVTYNVNDPIKAGYLLADKILEKCKH